ncbi:diaminopropionate ammonia-lyase [uncultured Acidaminococcus sp.]|uniref:diaminopropionate ammonia-lyase n=1 Tax=uncultured Acidaminococcus sp. TaxID=352152 RepID=UPI00280458E9|nr:diaminopropionate ammonia-lyase [uncultured Acidaminococcus sp.]
MENEIKIVTRKSSGKCQWDGLFTRQAAETAWNFHRTIPGYVPTPLVDLKGLAEHLGLEAFYVKDESFRFGLNAFKGLGGSFCVAQVLGEKLGIPITEMTFALLQDPAVHAKIKDLCFVTATDGNHGRGIAWTAHCLGVKSRVFMPKGSSRERLENIRALGSDACITEFNYDDTVRHAARVAEETGGVLVQDTAWEGYETIPGWIMEGYTTLALEAAEALSQPPTHIFLQAGVGAMSGALAGFFADYYGSRKPVITIVEPNRADCIFRTAAAGDGKLHTVTGALDTIMAGLACGEPCTLGWGELAAHAEHFASVPDWAAAQGMRILGAPVPGDSRVISGESGAVTSGFVCELYRNKELEPLKKELGLDKDSRVLCISTEGATDRESYRRIVWDGAWGKPCS